LLKIDKQGKADWKAALENVKGVYLIVDRSHGKMYVGSAYMVIRVFGRAGLVISVPGTDGTTN
jgi:hypothetical protein